MKCRYDNWSYPQQMHDDTLQKTHEIQHNCHHRAEYLKRMPEENWHNQATYNMAVRMEMRKRGFAVRKS